MIPERWQRVKHLLDEAIALSPAQRMSYLDGACAGDSNLKGEVISLLSSHEQAGTGFLETPAVDLQSAYVPPPTRLGRRISAYHIVSEIGHGGMGEVYRAYRADGQYEKEVAIKLVRGGFDSAAVLERFRHERQILASLDHPNIARLLDGGTTEEGIPYLVMELIEGTPVNQYCEAQQLNIAERLRLFLQVCAAVQYAHQRLVIHRDIKPGNILVTTQGTPKLLDFGIAKILDPAAASGATIAAPMTPEYASPEQIRGEPITTATDVYSLGVVLYELMVGRSPYLVKTSTPHEFARAVCEFEPERPSAAITRGDRAQSAGVDVSHSATRSLSKGTARLRRRLRGDLDLIVLKALRKEPQRRYASVEQFAGDIRRHLEGLPVTARPDSWRYRAAKFATRHKLGMAVTALILLLILLGVGATLRESRIAAANQRRAEARFNDVRRLAGSLMFEIQDSIEGVPGTANARQLIVQRSLEYLDRLAQESSGDISLQRELASAYDRVGALQGSMYESSIGDADAARRSLQKAANIREIIAAANPENGDDQIALARAYESLGRVQWLSSGGTSEGLQNLKKAVSIAESQAQKTGTVPVLEVLAKGYQYLGDMEGGSGLRGGTANLREAMQHHQKAIPLLKKIADANPSDPQKKYLYARAMLGAGDDYLHAGDALQALDYYMQAETVLSPLGQTQNALYQRGLATCQTRMGDALLMNGSAREALVRYRKEEALLKPLAAKDPRDTVVQLELVTSQGDIGHAMVEAGQLAEGTAALQRALADTIRVAKTANDSYARTLLASTDGLLGEAFARSGNQTAAQPYYARALELYSATASADPADLEDAVNAVVMRNHLADALLASRNLDASQQHYKTGLAAIESLADANPENIEVLYALADTYAGLGDVSTVLGRSTGKSAEWHDAEGWYGKSLTIWQKVPHPGPVSPNGFHARNPRAVASLVKNAKRQGTAPKRAG